MKHRLLLAAAFGSFFSVCFGQKIGQFESLRPASPKAQFQLPATHDFQVILEEGQPLGDGSQQPRNADFTGFVPKNGSSRSGFLAINSEVMPLGDVTILDVHFDELNQKWLVDASEKVDFDAVGGTRNNCSGGVTPWGTVLTCEENKSPGSKNAAGFNRFGYCLEIDPATRRVVNYAGGLPDGDKIWQMAFGDHENACVRSNRRTLYTGLDNAVGYLFKFVADEAENLSSGDLFAFKKTRSGSGEWLKVPNKTPAQVNNTLNFCKNAGATSFNGIEDVEIGPLDDMVYFAVKGDGAVYRFHDEQPLGGGFFSGFETFVGGPGAKYEVGPKTAKKQVFWGVGNDNLAFDDLGNLWILQDGSHNFIWVVGPQHTISEPDVRVFGIAPSGSEPTGITFTPDFEYLFMSFQHPFSGNRAQQKDASGMLRDFSKSATLVVSRAEFLGKKGEPAIAGSNKKNPVSSSLLAAELIEFTAEPEEKSIELRWITESERGCESFRVQRLEQGKIWQEIAVAAARGTTDSESWYALEDIAPLLGANHYRLKIVNFEGKTTISDLATAYFYPRQSSYGGRIFPNPARKTLQFQLDEHLPDEAVVVSVVNPQGIKKIEKTLSASSDGRYVFDISSLRSGNYFFQARSEDGRVLMSGKFAAE